MQKNNRSNCEPPLSSLMYYTAPYVWVNQHYTADSHSTEEYPSLALLSHTPPPPMERIPHFPSHKPILKETPHC